MSQASKKDFQTWSLRRGKVGLASVVIASGTLLFLGQAPQVQADELGPEVEAVSLSTVENDSPSTHFEEAVPYQAAPVEVQPEKTAETPAEAPVEKEVAVPLNNPSMKETASEAEVATSVTTAIKQEVSVPDTYLKEAKHPGPFTAGVNQVIPYEAFGGDGMLTRLLLKSSDGAPWSDNGTAMNPALAPVDKLAAGQYFYSFDLEGNAKGKMGADLLKELQMNPSMKYQGRVTVYGSSKGMADLTKIIASQQVQLSFHPVLTPDDLRKSLQNNTKERVQVPHDYIEKAKVDGPFLAGVNQVIPLEAFGGDGMLTRLLLKSADKAPWSNNGTAMNPALAIAQNLPAGKYFYAFELSGAGKGLMGQDLLSFLQKNQGMNISGTIVLYGSKDGKADMSQVLGRKEVHLSLAAKGKMDMPVKPQMDMSNKPQMKMMDKEKIENMKMDKAAPMMEKAQSSKSMANHMPMKSMSSSNMKTLPETGQKDSATLGLMGLLGLFASLGLVRNSKKKED